MLRNTSHLALRYDLDRPWARQPCDTENRWAAFVIFRDLPSPRKLADLDVDIEIDQLRRIARADGWHDRVAAYDRYLDEARVDAHCDILAEDGRTRGARHVRLLRDLQDAAAHVARGWLRRIEQNPDAVLHEFSPSDVTRMVKCAISLERLVHGESTENVAVAHFDLSRLSVSELDELRRIENKASE